MTRDELNKKFNFLNELKDSDLINLAIECWKSNSDFELVSCISEYIKTSAIKSMECKNSSNSKDNSKKDHST